MILNGKKTHLTNAAIKLKNIFEDTVKNLKKINS